MSSVFDPLVDRFFIVTCLQAAQRRLQRLAERIDAHGASPSGGASPTEVGCVRRSVWVDLRGQGGPL